MLKPTLTQFEPNTEGVWLDLPAEVYHKAPGVSQSRLKEFDEHATPLHYKNRKPKLPTPDMEFGTICHTAVLEPDNMPRAYYLQPETYPDEKGKLKPWHGGSTWCKNWLATHADRPVIDKEAELRIAQAAKRVIALPEFGAALRAGQREVSCFKKDAATGLLCKCRLDCMATTEDGVTWIFDMKKVQSGEADHDNFQKTALDRGYHIQAASYLQLTGASRFVFVPFDDDVPFDAAQWELDEDVLKLGAVEYRRILNAFAECVYNDEWPGYAPGIAKIVLPRWAKKRLEDLIA
jgi:exodeoxyribonuclease VIII